MATKDDRPPNSGLWGHVQVEALPNPGSLPPPPPDNTPVHRGTLMGFAVPPAVANANLTQPGPVRRTPTTGTAQPRQSSKTLTSGVVPPTNFEGTVVPPTTPIGVIPKDTMLTPGGEPKARGYYHATQATRTLIGGSVPSAPVHSAPVPSPNASGATGTAGVSAGVTGKRETAPGFSALSEQPVDRAVSLGKNTLLGVAMPPSGAPRAGLPEAASDHPTYRSPPSETAASTERNLPAVNVATDGSTPQPQFTPPLPPINGGNASHLGRFRIQKRLGAGGVGAVYLASKVDASGSGQQLLAVKVLREHFYRDPSTLKALFREARLAARMDHRHIVRVFDIGYHNKHPYLVMEYVDGLSLTTLLGHSQELPLGIGIRCLIDALHGLDFAHKLRGDEGEPLGLVHCDVSPQNILVGVDGVAKVTDFGVARTREEDGDEFVLRCKPEFAAPELLQGEPVRPETDVFSAGAVLYRIATGRTVFPGETEEEIVDNLLNTEPTPPTEIDPDLPEFLDAFCAQALAKAVGDRFRTCLDMARSLERQAEAAGLLADRRTVGAWVQQVRRELEHGERPPPRPVETRPTPVEPELPGIAPTRRERRSNPVAIGATLAALAIAGGAAWWWLNLRSEQQMEERRQERAVSPGLTLTPPSDPLPVATTPLPTTPASLPRPALQSTDGVATSVVTAPSAAAVVATTNATPPEVRAAGSTSVGVPAPKAAGPLPGHQVPQVAPRAVGPLRPVSPLPAPTGRPAPLASAAPSATAATNSVSAPAAAGETRPSQAAPVSSAAKPTPALPGATSTPPSEVTPSVGSRGF